MFSLIQTILKPNFAVGLTRKTSGSLVAQTSWKKGFVGDSTRKRRGIVEC